MDDLKLRLAIGLVPKPCWRKSLHRILSKSAWKKVRDEVLHDAANLCEICGSEEGPHCHERWEYDDDHRVQRLVGVACICKMCHFVAHFGLAKQLAADGQLNLQAVIDHFCAVNEVDRGVFESHLFEVSEKWRKRSERKWKTDYGSWKYLVT